MNVDIRIGIWRSAGSRAGNEQSFKIQLAQDSIGKDDHGCVGAKQRSGRRQKHLVKRLAVRITALHRVLRIQECFAIALDARL